MPNEQQNIPASEDDELNTSIAVRIRDSLIVVVAGVSLALLLITAIQFDWSKVDWSLPEMAAALPAHSALTDRELSSIGHHDNSSSCDLRSADRLKCLMPEETNMCATGSGELCESDLEIATIAWKYFQNNYNPETGLVNSVNDYHSTTMWDTGSSLSAYIAAKDFGLIDQKQFDDAIMALLETMSTMKLFDGAAPNKVYHTKTRKMVNYKNEDSPDGIGVSVLDLARLISWMNTLQCMHPEYHAPVNTVLSRWDYTRLVKNEELYGMARDDRDHSNILSLQEGRLGYEQYAGKIFKKAGFSVNTAASYNNKHRNNTDILGIDIAFDKRDPREYVANNYVVTESYVMDAMELGVDDENRQLIRNIFEVQKKRWQQTGIITAISEDNIDREPWFIYNTIFNAGLKFSTISEVGEDFDHLKTVSTKAAMTMAMLYPDDPYSSVLLSAIKSAYDPDGGWYSGVFESGAGYNDVTTANTNGVIMSGLLHKKYGALYKHCETCAKPLKIASELVASLPTE